MIKIWIDNQEISASAGKTILEICREHQIFIPTFCHDERLEPHSACFICVVEIEGRSGLQPSCSTIAEDGMRILTNSEAVRATRKMNLELQLSNHVGDCYAPCRLKCPALVDIPGYISLAARKKYAAVKPEGPPPTMATFLPVSGFGCGNFGPPCARS